MKTRKIVSSAAVAFLVMAFFVSGAPTTRAAISTNASANVVIGQANLITGTANQGGGSAAINTINDSRGVFYDGSHLFVADRSNNRVLVYNSIPTASDASADIVIGQADMTHNDANRGGAVAANTLYYPVGVYSDGEKLFIADTYNNRVLVYNSIPTTNGASADIVIGQADFTHNDENQGVAAAAGTMYHPYGVFSNGAKLFVSDSENHRILIFNSIPTTNGASADVVIGQQNMTAHDSNQGGSVGANTLDIPYGIYSNGVKLFVADSSNNRVLIFNSIPTENNASANIVVGQANLTSDSDNLGVAAANTLYYPVSVFPYGGKLLVAERYNNRVLVYNTIPTNNGASADIVIGQADFTHNDENQGGTVSAASLSGPRFAFVGGTKLFVSDGDNNRVSIFSFGSQYTISKNHSKTVSGGEKIKVKKKKIEISGKKTAYKKGKVKIYRNGNYVKKAKVKNNGKWKLNFKDTGSAVKTFVFKYYNSSGTLQYNSETYVIGVDRGSLVEATLEKMSFDGTAGENNADNGKKTEKFNVPDAKFISD